MTASAASRRTLSGHVRLVPLLLALTAVAAPAAGGERVAGVDASHWAYDALRDFKEAGAELRVPRDANGVLINRWELLLRAQRLYRESVSRLHAGFDRWQGNPRLTWDLAQESEFASRAVLMRWLMNRINDPLLAASPLPPGGPSVGGFPQDPTPFADVPADHPLRGLTRVSQGWGHFTGYPDGSFHGDRKASLPEVAVVAQRVACEVMRLSAARCWLRKNGDAPAVTPRPTLTP